MPDAIITSTESTFGTISGTFAADQSTISGTILGPVAGNLSGSVGVPGPAGVGVPAGGLEGQIIVKASETDYDTVWVDNSAETLTATVRNETGATLTKGTVVYINGAAGNKATVTKASASSESGSSKTFAILKDDIPNNQNGTAVTVGLLKGVDTSAFSPGANLWLSTTAGQITQTMPTSPNHAVFLGNAVRIHANQGEIEVRIQNGLELGELHDVLIHDVANGQVLKYDSAQGLWVNGTDVGGVAWGGITGTLSDQTDLQSALNAKYDASNPSGFITSSALSPYLTTASASATYQTLSGMADYLSKAGNLSGLASVSTARDNLGLGSLSTPTFAGVTVQGSGSNVANLTPTSLSLTHATSGSFVIQPSVGITFPDATVQTTAYPGPPGATTWGSITGTLSSQTDLQTALDGKYSTSNPSGYITSSALTGYATESFVTSQGYITSSALSPYLLSSTAASTYQTIAGMSSYLTTSAAASTYYPLTNPSGYITSSALSGYATESWVTAGFYPLSSNPAGYLTSASLSGYATESWVTSELGSYLTTSAAASTYAALAGATFTGVVGFNGSSGNVAAKSTGHFKAYTSGAESTDYSLQYDTGFQVVVGGSTVARIASSGILAPSAGITFSDATTQTTAGVSAATVAATYAPLASPALTGNPTAPTPATADNDTSIATTAFVKAQGYLTSAPVTSVAGKTGAVTLVVGDVSGAAPLASPTFTGTPAAPTASAGTNTTQIATTAFVTSGLNLKANLASPTFTGTPAAPTASAGTSTTQLATTAFVTTADNLKANLASPAFTGTPTAPTATAGTNTTQIATTAFVTAAVPTAATHIQSLQFASTTAYTRVIDASSQLIAPSVLKVWPSPSNYNGTSTSGAGASALLYLTGYVLTSPSAGVAGNARAFHGNIAGDLGYMMWGGSSGSQINFSRRVSMAFRFSQFPSSTSSVTRVLLGKIHGTAVGDLTSRGIGVKYVPNGSNFDFQLQVHNGTTLTSVTSSTQYAGGVADLEVVSDGAGNAVLYLNGAQVASTTGAPTGTTSSNATVFAEVESQATTANQPVASIGRLYVNTLNF